MNEYDQERFTEVCEELDAAREKIKCLEAEIRTLRIELHETTDTAVEFALSIASQPTASST